MFPLHRPNNGTLHAASEHGEVYNVSSSSTRFRGMALYKKSTVFIGAEANVKILMVRAGGRKKSWEKREEENIRWGKGMTTAAREGKKSNHDRWPHKSKRD